MIPRRKNVSTTNSLPGRIGSTLTDPYKMNEIYIPSYRLVDDSKPHYVYLIHIASRDSCHLTTVEKRYSAFHSLHRELRKYFSTPSFPPKRIRCSQVKVLEQRRKELEKYLQTMFSYSPSRAHVAAFLGVPIYSNSFINKSTVVNHKPVFKIETVNYPMRSSLPNIVRDGVLYALYGRKAV